MSEINYKFILIGNSREGKSMFFRKIATGGFDEKNITTIGLEKKTLDFNLDVYNKEGKIENKNFCISLFDTAGQEKFRAVTRNYYKGSDGIFFIYDITDKLSFESMDSWINSIRDNLGNTSDSKYAMILIGNKLDLVEEGIAEKQVAEDEAKQMCEKYDMIWGGEQSIKNLDFEAFTKLLEKYIGEIYKIVGEKQLGKQRPKNLANFEKKENKEINYIHALNKYISF